MSSLATMKSDRFGDFDEFASSIEDADMSMKLPRLDRSLWSMLHVSLPDSINIQVAYEGSGSIPCGAVREDGFVLFLAEGDCRGNGKRIDRDSVFLMPPGKEFSNPTKGENEYIDDTERDGQCLPKGQVFGSWERQTRIISELREENASGDPQTKQNKKSESVSNCLGQDNRKHQHTK